MHDFASDKSVLVFVCECQVLVLGTLTAPGEHVELGFLLAHRKFFIYEHLSHFNLFKI